MRFNVIRTINDFRLEKDWKKTLRRKIMVHSFWRPNVEIASLRPWIHGAAINLGCGYRRIKGTVSVDRDPKVKPDIVSSLEELKLRNLDCIVAMHVAEHNNFGTFLDSCWHLLRVGGHLCMTLPNYDYQGPVVYHRDADHRWEARPGDLFGRLIQDPHWRIRQYNTLQPRYPHSFEVVLEKQ